MDVTGRGPEAGPAGLRGEPALVVDRLLCRFGAITALDGVSLTVMPGERRAIIGTNGAGKTTLFNAICGDHDPTGGRVSFFGRAITRWPPHRRARLGLGRTYQNSLLFSGLTVTENLFVAARGAAPFRLSLLEPRRDDPVMAHVRAIAERVRLTHVAEEQAGFLSHGQRRQLEVGMALATRPRLLMLDEPAAGLSAIERPELSRLLRELSPDLTLILIEHDMEIALANTDVVTVMKEGRIVAEDVSDRVSLNPLVQSIYLGTGE